MAKKDYSKFTINLDKEKKIVELTIVNMSKEARKRLSYKIMNDEPINIVFFEIG